MILLFRLERFEGGVRKSMARALAVSAPLTGLATIACLLDRLDSEIKRYQPTVHFLLVLLPRSGWIKEDQPMKTATWWVASSLPAWQRLLS